MIVTVIVMLALQNYSKYRAWHKPFAIIFGVNRRLAVL